MGIDKSHVLSRIREATSISHHMFPRNPITPVWVWEQEGVETLRCWVTLPIPEEALTPEDKEKIESTLKQCHDYLGEFYETTLDQEDPLALEGYLFDQFVLWKETYAGDVKEGPSESDVRLSYSYLGNVLESLIPKVYYQEVLVGSLGIYGRKDSTAMLVPDFSVIYVPEVHRKGERQAQPGSQHYFPDELYNLMSVLKDPEARYLVIEPREGKSVVLFADKTLREEAATLYVTMRQRLYPYDEAPESVWLGGVLTRLLQGFLEDVDNFNLNPNVIPHPVSASCWESLYLHFGKWNKKVKHTNVLVCSCLEIDPNNSQVGDCTFYFTKVTPLERMEQK